jgi:hypothetical protein
MAMKEKNKLDLLHQSFAPRPGHDKVCEWPGYYEQKSQLKPACGISAASLFRQPHLWGFLALD